MEEVSGTFFESNLPFTMKTIGIGLGLTLALA
jgi:hypothetical protein